MASGDEQLISFIAKAREKGRSDEQIARSLYSVGWRKERVDAAFMNANEARTGAFAPAEGERHAPGEEKQAPEEEKEPAQQGRVRLSTPLGGSRLQSTSPAQLELRPTGRESAQHFPEGSPPNMQPQQPSMQPAPSRITPPSRPQQPPMVQPEQQPQEQPIYPQEEKQPASRLPLQPTIPRAQERAPLDLPHGPDYQPVQEESQVQNPAFQKVEGGMSKIDIEFIVRIVIFLIILGAIIGAYLYLTGSGSPIIVSG